MADGDALLDPRVPLIENLRTTEDFAKVYLEMTIYLGEASVEEARMRIAVLEAKAAVYKAKVIGDEATINTLMAAYLDEIAREQRLKYAIRKATLFVDFVGDHLPNIVGASAQLQLKACDDRIAHLRSDPFTSHICGEIEGEVCVRVVLLIGREKSISKNCLWPLGAFIVMCLF
jgi:hypothetical protein